MTTKHERPFGRLDTPSIAGAAHTVVSPDAARGPGLAQGGAASIDLAESRSEQTLEDQAKLDNGGAVEAPAPRAPLRVLVIEDDAMIAWVISETLTEMGHEVCGIANCEDDAVTLAALERPNLMLVDAHLYAGSGPGAVRRILLNGPVPHIFISGDIVSAGDLGPSALALQKPFQDVDLERAIREALATRPPE
jgi:CheY-like chemotaxis protein